METDISPQGCPSATDLVSRIPTNPYPDVTEMLLSDNCTARGMASNYQILVHSQPCIVDPPINFFEIDFCIVLARHLLLQSYQGNEFVIVTTNAFQLKYIKQAIRLLEEFDTSISVLHIDEYINDATLNPKIAIVTSANLHNTCSGENVDPIVFARVEKLFEVLFEKQSVGFYMLVNASLFSLSANLKELGVRLKLVGCINTSFRIKCSIHGTVSSICSSEQLLDTAPDGGCTKPCLFRHSCGHQCPLQCHSVDREHKGPKYSCKLKCEKACPRGHMTCRRLCYEPCTDCEELVKKSCDDCYSTRTVKCFKYTKLCKRSMKKKFNPCNHEVTFFCYEASEKNLRCSFKLSRVLACKHVKEYMCYEQLFPSTRRCDVLVTVRRHPEITTHISEEEVPCHRAAAVAEQPCKEMLLTSFPAVCGHKVIAPCNEHYDWRSSLLPKYCTEKCGFTKGCGHPCSGSCQDCFNGIFHLRCKEVPCKRILDCTHECSATCSSACIPCDKPCLITCEHGKCKKLCSYPCNDCNEPCQWECAHFKCTKKCSEPCDRETCMEPCPIQLNCGHDCIGFCGEPCPPICRVCNSEKLAEFDILCAEDGETAKIPRYIWFKDGCGHILEYDALRALLTTGEAGGDIRFKTCPFCRGILWNCRPFDKSLVPIRARIVQRKMETFGSEEDLFRRKKQIYLETQVQEHSTRSYESGTFRHFNKFLMDTLCGSQYNVDNGIFLEVPLSTLAHLESFSKYYKTATSNMYTFWSLTYRAKSNLSTQVKMMYDVLEQMYDRLFLFIMSRPHPLYNTEISDINREVNRLTDFYLILQLRIAWQNQSKETRAKLNVEPTFEVAMRAMLSLCPYDSNLRNAATSAGRVIEDIFLEQLILITSLEDRPPQAVARTRVPVDDDEVWEQ